MFRWTLTAGCVVALACASFCSATSAKETQSKPTQNVAAKSASKSAPSKSAPSKTAATKYVKSIILDQTHYFLGQVVVNLSKTAVRVESVGAYKFILVAKAPEWKVIVYRNDDKTFHESSLKEFSESGLLSQYLVGMTAPSIRGRDVTMTKSIGDIPIKARRNNYALCEYIPLTNEIAPECRAILFNTYRIPNCDGITIKYVEQYVGKDWMTGVDETGHWKSKLATTASSIKDVDQKQYELPANYKKVLSMPQVVTGNATRSKTEGGAADLLRSN